MTLTRYVVSDLLRNPRRTLATVVGVALGVGLLCGVLFFVDGLSASMTDRAVAPLSIDMQRIVTDRTGSSLTLDQTLTIDTPSPTPTTLAAGERASVDLVITNTGVVAANEVTIRSLPATALRFVAGSALADGEPIEGVTDNPFAHGAGQTGHNLGTIQPGVVLAFRYTIEATDTVTLDDAAVTTSYSSRESVSPIGANQPPPVPLGELVHRVAQVDGVAYAFPLSLADLGPASLSAGDSTVAGPTKIIGIDGDDAARDDTIAVVEGRLSAEGAVVSAEAARELGAGVGDTVTIDLPDGSVLRLVVSGVADLSRSRALFSSRRGGDLETFDYVPNSVIVSATTFADTVQPAYERAMSERGTRLKAPPIREVTSSSNGRA